MPISTLPPNTATGQDLVVALLGVARRLKARLPQGHLEPGMMFVLHQVQANGSLRVSELASQCHCVSPTKRHSAPPD